MINHQLNCDYLTIVDFFKSIELFRPLCPSNIVKMVNTMDKITLQKGEMLIEQGRLIDGLFIVFRGELEINYDDGRSSSIQKKGYIGSNAILAPVIFPGKIIAKRTSKILVFRKKNMCGTIAQSLNPHILKSK